jgi:L-fucose/D-arabinose isomerase
VTHDFFERYLGMRVETVDMVEFVRRSERKVYDEAELARALAWVKENCKEGKDHNPEGNQLSAAEKARVWEWSVKMTLIARDLMIGNPRLADRGFHEEALGHNALAAGFQGQRHWTDHLSNGDFMEAILCSSFDWNGLRQPFIMATENDSLNAATMLAGHLVTGTAQVFADVRTYWSPASVKKATNFELTGPAAGGILHLINSGAAALDGCGWQKVHGQPAMKPFWEITETEVRDCLAATTWYAAISEYFRGGGFSSQFVTLGGMPITMARINLVQGLGPALQLAEGWTVGLPEKVHRVLDERTNPTWPTTWFAPRLSGQGVFRDGYTVMNAWGANHCAFSYGHIGAELLTLAAMLRIPVYMHNVPEEDIFRPSAWHAFGTAGLEGADYRACANFGPLYGKI